MGDAQVAQLNHASRILHKSHAGAFASEAVGIDPFLDQCAIEGKGDFVLRFADAQSDVEPVFVIEGGEGQLAKPVKTLLFFDRPQINVSVDGIIHAQTVKAAEVRPLFFR